MKVLSYPVNAATGVIGGVATCANSSDAYTAARATADSCDNESYIGYLTIGQLELDTGPGGWFWAIRRSYISFDTSVIGTAAFTGASLFVLSGTDAEDYLGSDDSNILVYAYDSDADLCGAQQEANWDGAYGVNATLEGTLVTNTTGLQNSTWYHIEVSTSNISTTGSTTYTLVCKADVDNDDSKNVGDPWFDHSYDRWPILQLAVPGGFAWIF